MKNFIIHFINVGQNSFIILEHFINMRSYNSYFHFQNFLFYQSDLYKKIFPINFLTDLDPIQAEFDSLDLKIIEIFIDFFIKNNLTDYN
jgi:hypothetical protein